MFDQIDSSYNLHILHWVHQISQKIESIDYFLYYKISWIIDLDFLLMIRIVQDFHGFPCNFPFLFEWLRIVFYFFCDFPRDFYGRCFVSCSKILLRFENSFQILLVPAR